MSYTPKSEEQLIKEGLMPDGEYDFEVADTDDKPSGKGNPMHTLKLHVFDCDGKPRIVTDYISWATNYGERKLRHAADTCGIIDTYNSGSLSHIDFRGKSGKAVIKTQEASGAFPAKNVVDYYVKREFWDTQPHNAPAAAKARQIDPALDDEIPF